VKKGIVLGLVEMWRKGVGLGEWDWGSLGWDKLWMVSV
jgi:hypothetical protein